MHHLLHAFLHPLKVLWIERITLFWPIWIALTVLGVILVIWSVPQRKEVHQDAIPSKRKAWSREAILAVIILALLLTFLAAGFLVWDDFTYYDNSHFTNGTLAGHDINLQISPKEGRFWPLGHQEFNLLRHITSSIIGYQSLRIVQLLVVCAILLFTDEELSVPARVGLIILLLITPSILISFSGLIYPEANVILSLVCLVWSLKRFERTRFIGWAVAAAISSQFLLYYKETAFLLLVGIAIGRLVIRCWKQDQAGWDFKRLHDPESHLDICLALLALTFLLYYLAAIYPEFGTHYADKLRLPLLQVLRAYLALDLLAWIFVVVWIARTFLVLRRKVVPSLQWDALALAGICYLAGYLFLHMVSSYYLAPVDLIAVLYLGRLAFLGIEGMSLAIRSCALVVLSLVLVQDCSLSGFRMYERKNVIHAKAELGDVIKERFQSEPQNAKRLFFPFAKPFQILEFASYLNYIGVPVEQTSDGTVVSHGVILVGKAIQKNGPCGYRTFVCHPGNIPEPGDLVVVLPDDFTSVNELNTYRQRSSMLLISYDPRPPIPQWMWPFVDRLHVVSPIFALQQLPDSFLMASVSVWK
jgi:hypothetical protein